MLWAIGLLLIFLRYCFSWEVDCPSVFPSSTVVVELMRLCYSLSSIIITDCFRSSNRLKTKWFSWLMIFTLDSSIKLSWMKLSWTNLAFCNYRAVVCLLALSNNVYYPKVRLLSNSKSLVDYFVKSLYLKLLKIYSYFLITVIDLVIGWNCGLPLKYSLFTLV